MTHHSTLISVIVLLLNSLTVIIFAFNISRRLRSAINAASRLELDFYFKLILLSVIGAVMSGISFYIGVKLWLRTSYLMLDGLANLRLVYAVLMAAMASVVSIIDSKYNPFGVK